MQKSIHYFHHFAVFLHQKDQMSDIVLNMFSLCLQEHMIQNEVSILSKVKHPNIVELIEEFDSHTELFLVMELVKVTILFSI